MKLKCKQYKFIELLEKLYLGGIFPMSTITVEKKKDKTYLYSVQKGSGTSAMRYLKVDSAYFDELEPSDKSIDIEVAKHIKLLKNVSSDTDITATLEGNKLAIDLGKAKPRIAYSEPENILSKLPIKFSDGIPLFGKKEFPLDCEFTMKLVELKDIVSYANAISAEFYQFMSTGKRISVRIGDIHNVDDYVPYDTETKLSKGKSLDVTYSFGIGEISKTFSQNELTCNCATDRPAWIYEKGEDFILGVAIPPKIKEQQ